MPLWSSHHPLRRAPPGAPSAPSERCHSVRIVTALLSGSFVRIFERTSLVIGAVAASLLIAEGCLRLVGYSYTPLRIEVIRNNEWRPYHAFQDKHFVYDSALIWRPKIGFSIFNSQGYRGRELAPTKGARELRIFTFGDSNTLGWSGPAGPNWPEYLQRLFDQTGASVTVVNAGVYGYSAFQGLERFKEALPLKPDMALISFGGNDAHLVAASDSEFANRLGTWTRVEYAVARAKVGQLILAVLDRFGGKRDERVVPRVSLEDYRRYLEQIANLGEAHKIRIVLLTRPFTGESPHPLWWKHLAPAYNAATIDVGKRNGLPVIDVYSYFMHAPEYFSDESHFTEAGHRRMAELMYERLRPLLR
jgi:lysophospholipase L1-like esterase